MFQFRTSKATPINQTIALQNLLTRTSTYNKNNPYFPNPLNYSPHKSPQNPLKIPYKIP